MKKVAIRLALAALYTLAVVGGATGIALLAVGDGPQGEAGATGERGPAGPEGPAGDYRDIEELYARTDYTSCTRDANVHLDDVEAAMDDSYAVYLAGNSNYSDYLAARSAYETAFDQYQADMDDCWTAYLADSPSQ